MKCYSINEAPIKVYGIPFFDKTKKLTRLPDELTEKLPNLDFLGRRVPGGRVCFRTNSENINIKVKFKTLSVDIGMAIYACQSISVFVGEKTSSKFLGIAPVPNYDVKEINGNFKKSSEMEDVTILLPRNEILDTVEIFIDDNAEILINIQQGHIHSTVAQQWYDFGVNAVKIAHDILVNGAEYDFFQNIETAIIGKDDVETYAKENNISLE